MLTNEMIRAYQHYVTVYNKEIKKVIVGERCKATIAIETAYQPFRRMLLESFDKTTITSILEILLKNENLQIPIEKNLGKLLISSIDKY